MSTFNYLDAISIYLRLVSPKMKVKQWNLEKNWRYHSILHNHLPELPFRKHRSLHFSWKPESVYRSSSSTMQPFCLKQPSPPKGVPNAPSAWKGSPSCPTSSHPQPIFPSRWLQIILQMLEQMSLPQGMLWWLGPIPSLYALFISITALRQFGIIHLFVPLFTKLVSTHLHKDKDCIWITHHWHPLL